MTIQHFYPATRPSLDLNFAGQKRLDPRVTFTRASTATYVGSDGLIKTAASDEARFDHDPETGESLGLLVEESRTNLLIHSEEFDNAAWSKTGATVTANTTAAPDGATTADTLTKTGSTGFTEQGSITVSSGASYTYSVYAKANSMTWLALRTVTGFTDDYFYFDLSTGAIGQSATQGTQSIQKLSNGWYRCSVTATTTATTCGVRIYGATADENPGGTGTIFIWGAQLETGSFPTSYIPTAGTTATRAADVASMTGTNFSSWYNQNEGTVFVETEKPTLTNTVAVSISDGTNQNSIELRSSGSTADTVRFNIYKSGLEYNDAFTVDTAYKRLIFAYAENNSHAVANGILRTTDTSVSIPTVDNLYFGNNLFLQTQRPGHIKRFTYYDRRLTDAQLQALTL